MGKQKSLSESAITFVKKKKHESGIAVNSWERKEYKIARLL